LQSFEPDPDVRDYDPFASADSASHNPDVPDDTRRSSSGLPAATAFELSTDCHDTPHQCVASPSASAGVASSDNSSDHMSFDDGVQQDVANTVFCTLHTLPRPFRPFCEISASLMTVKA
jgi:hypothetical protein